MRPEIVLKPEFVEFIPETLEERTLYVAAKYRTVVHQCCCGCGHKVVTPLSPVSWKLTFDGVHITLYPSVGNWNLPCQSHYWIENNRVKWAALWTPGQVEAGRLAEERARDVYYGTGTANASSPPASPASTAAPPNTCKPSEVPPPEGFWRRWKRRLFG